MPTSLRTVADRRVRDAQASGLEVRGPLSKSLGRTGSPGRTPGSRGTGLTRRERKVKAVLLKELERMHKGGKTWVSYQEREKLFEALDVGFIDREIAKMEHQLRPRPVLVGVVAAIGVTAIALKVATHAGEPFTWWAAFDVVLWTGWLISMAYGFDQSRKATQRRLWIYQALRELSDADDEDVQLDESVRLADLLIDRIIDAEDAAAPAPLHRIRTH